MRPILNLLLNNLGYKLLALGLAFLIWFYLVSQGTKEDTIENGVLEVEVPEGWTILYRSARSVTLRVYGPQLAVDQLKRQKVHVRIQIDPAKLGKHEPPVTLIPKIKTDDLVLPQDADLADMRLLEATPERMTLVIDRVEEREVRVKPVTLGTPEPGCQLEARPVSETCLVRGPQSVLAKLDSLKTQPIPVRRLKPGIYTREVALETELDPRSLGDPRMEKYDPVRVSPRDKVEVVITVSPVTSERVLRGLRICTLVPPGFERKLILDKEEVDLAVTGPADILEKLTPADVRVFVDLIGMDQFPQLVPLRVIFSTKLRNEVKLKGESPQILCKLAGGSNE